MGRISARERRESVIRAAIAEFAIAGYHGTTTAAIARRVGVTQPSGSTTRPGNSASSSNSA